MLQPDKTFETNWLDKRYAYDSAARDQKVENACLEYLSDKSSVTIVDLGSGTGSNCIYFLEKMPATQKWIFVEHDEVLSQYALGRIRKHASENGYTIQNLPKKLILQKEERKVEVEYFTESLLDLKDKIDLSTVDLVAASAVFDLLSFPQFVDLASLLLENEIALLSTMNYAEMSFDPEEATDVLFVKKYEEHMTRKQDFGKAMGKNCSRMMVKFFRQHEKEVTCGASVWNLKGKEEEETHSYLLRFMKSAVSELLEEEENIQLFAKWLYLKKELAAEGKLKTTIQHYDIFVK